MLQTSHRIFEYKSHFLLKAGIFSNVGGHPSHTSSFVRKHFHIFPSYSAQVRIIWQEFIQANNFVHTRRPAILYNTANMLIRLNSRTTVCMTFRTKLGPCMNFVHRASSQVINDLRAGARTYNFRTFHWNVYSLGGKTEVLHKCCTSTEKMMCELQRWKYIQGVFSARGSWEMSSILVVLDRFLRKLRMEPRCLFTPQESQLGQLIPEPEPHCTSPKLAILTNHLMCTEVAPRTLCSYAYRNQFQPSEENLSTIENWFHSLKLTSKFPPGVLMAKGIQLKKTKLLHMH